MLLNIFHEFVVSTFHVENYRFVPATAKESEAAKTVVYLFWPPKQLTNWK